MVSPKNQSAEGSITISVVIKGLDKLSDAIGLSPIQVFNAVPDALFSVAAELAPPALSLVIPLLALPGGLLCSVQAQTSSPPGKPGSLEKGFGKAKPSMVASADRV